MDTKILFRGMCLASALMAGSCASHAPDATHMSEDGAFNHPITVEPSYQAIKLYYSPADSGIQPADQARFASFIADYEAHGNGSIAVSAPSGMNSRAMIGFFAQRINDMGVSKDHILVATHDAPDGDMRVEINYVSYSARTDKCGDWSQDLAFTGDNDTPKNFGCSVQQNIAAQVADPRDLIQPRDMDDANSARRATVINNYELGKITSAVKNKADMGNEQSGTSSDVSTQ
jgi:pilus assembly protein CpaD